MPIAGVTIAGPRNIPLGTRVYIQGLGVRVVTDRLAHRFDNRFDIFMPDHQTAQHFGLQKLTITILK
ncbi:MAG TPA: 3D domain-containing protein [Verrucomicrobiae bacterium]|jgi:3D (Asp-Asp-Asp) domain-containing protein|nr:3D domain-containing protein [Verrucomicrobiae bacterium]